MADWIPYNFSTKNWATSAISAVGSSLQDAFAGSMAGLADTVGATESAQWWRDNARTDYGKEVAEGKTGGKLQKIAYDATELLPTAAVASVASGAAATKLAARGIGGAVSKVVPTALGLGVESASNYFQDYRNGVPYSFSSSLILNLLGTQAGAFGNVLRRFGNSSVVQNANRIQSRYLGSLLRRIPRSSEFGKMTMGETSEYVLENGR